MKNIRTLSLALSFLLLLSACSPSAPPTETKTEEIPAQITEVQDPFALLRTAEEKWIQYGLKAYEEGTEAASLKDFFSDRANLSYLTLYETVFAFNEEQAIAVSEALFRFITDTHGAKAVLDLEKRTQYKNEYLVSLGLKGDFNQSTETDKLLIGLKYTSGTQAPYIFSFPQVHYYFQGIADYHPSSLHGFLYFNTSGLQKMIAYLEEMGLDSYLDTKRSFHFYMELDGSAPSSTNKATGNMTIRSSNAALHEAVHSMGLHAKSHLWLSEGLCSYLGEVMGFQDQIGAAYIQTLTAIKNGSADTAIANGDPKALLQKEVLEKYSRAGGGFSSLEEFDFPLFTDSVAKAELETGIFDSLEQSRQEINEAGIALNPLIGGELSYSQSASLVSFLIEQHGIEAVFEAWQNDDLVSFLGGDFEQLKALWLDHLAAI